MQAWVKEYYKVIFFKVLCVVAFAFCCECIRRLNKLARGGNAIMQRGLGPAAAWEEGQV